MAPQCLRLCLPSACSPPAPHNARARPCCFKFFKVVRAFVGTISLLRLTSFIHLPGGGGLPHKSRDRLNHHSLTEAPCPGPRWPREQAAGSPPSQWLLFCLPALGAIWTHSPILWPPDAKKLTHWKRPWCWERLKAGEGDDRGWHGWMASPTQWAWVWVNSGSWWWTGRPGVLQSTEVQSWTWLSDWTELTWNFYSWFLFCLKLNSLSFMSWSLTSFKSLLKCQTVWLRNNVTIGNKHWVYLRYPENRVEAMGFSNWLDRREKRERKESKWGSNYWLV